MSAQFARNRSLRCPSENASVACARIADEVFHGEGFGEVIKGVVLEGLTHRFHRGIARHDDDAEALTAWSSRRILFAAVPPHHVQEDEVGQSSFACGEEFGGSGDRTSVVTFAFEHAEDVLAKISSSSSATMESEGMGERGADGSVEFGMSVGQNTRTTRHEADAARDRSVAGS